LTLVLTPCLLAIRDLRKERKQAELLINKDEKVSPIINAA